MGASLAKKIFFMRPDKSTYSRDTDYWVDKLIYINKNHKNTDPNN